MTARKSVPGAPAARGNDGARASVVRFAVLSSFVVIAAFARLVPHPPNFTPVGAIALFGGAHFGSRLAAVGVPLVALIVTDPALAAAQGGTLDATNLVVYACIAATALLGAGLRGRVRPGAIAMRSLAGALLFFVATNFAVWAGGGLYPRTVAGLVACYVAAVPYLACELAAYGVYGLLLFGGFRVLERRVAALAPAPARA